MTIAISTLLRGIQHEVERTPLKFGLDDMRAKQVCEHLADQFLRGGEVLSLAGFGEAAELDARVSHHAETEQQGRAVLDYLTRQVAHALADGRQVTADHPAVLTAAREIAAQIGLPEFHDLLDDVLKKSGVEVTGNVQHGTRITALGDGRVEICRTVQWDGAGDDGPGLGKVKAQWAMTCGLDVRNLQRITLAADVSEAELLFMDGTDPSEGQALAAQFRAPSVFAEFLSILAEAITYCFELLGSKAPSVHLEYVSEAAQHDEGGVPGEMRQWRGWRASKDAVGVRLVFKALDSAAHEPSAGSTGLTPGPAPDLGAKSPEYRENKFRFEYTAEGLSVQEKMLEEDRRALNVLRLEETATTVKSVACKLADHLETTIPLRDRQQFHATYAATLEGLKQHYPVPHEIPASFDDFLATLRTHDDCAVVLSLIWPVFMRQGAGSRVQTINGLYGHLVGPTKDFAVDETKIKIPAASRFGNSQTIESHIFSPQTFVPFFRSVDYIQQNANSPNLIVKKMIAQERPYISGLSGMANMTCKVLDALDIHPFSPEGKKYCEAMGAFIVGSGMHSYYEVYKSLNFYARVVTPLSTMDAYSEFSGQMV